MKLAHQCEGSALIGVGKTNSLAMEGLRTVAAQMTRLGIHHTYMLPKAHDFAVWRWCLVQFAPAVSKLNQQAVAVAGQVCAKLQNGIKEL